MSQPPEMRKELTNKRKRIRSIPPIQISREEFEAFRVDQANAIFGPMK